jgi:hypothetical protein
VAAFHGIWQSRIAKGGGVSFVFVRLLNKVRILPPMICRFSGLLQRFVGFYFCLTLVNANPLVGKSWTPEKSDRVALVGDAFFERDYLHGELETALTLATAGKELKIRNLGWSGDTPRCESRSYFGPPAEGFQRLDQQLKEMKPHTILACYGAVDAFQGEKGLADFVQAYRTWIAMAKSSGVREIILLTPPPCSADVVRWPSLANENSNRALYAAAIGKLAKEENISCADFFTHARNVSLTTINGVTYTHKDYSNLAVTLVSSLGLAEGKTTASSALRDLILAKNRFFFQQWRPQNEIYLFGSRKHEQGQNGADMPKFNPLIEAKEGEIFQVIAK